MRNRLVLLAAFTLSTSTAITAVACGANAFQTTSVIFDWNGIINGEGNNKTADEFFTRLLDNPQIEIGQSLYKDIVDYTSLSILKTSANFTEDYQFAKQSVENQIKNIQDSLKSKYGRSWEAQWKKFLNDPAQGGDGKTGSYQRYFDVLLKNKANTIVSQYYVGDNYHNYQYYTSTEISIWLNDIFDKIKNEKQTMIEYLASGAYKDKVWIVSKSVNENDDKAFTELDKTIKESTSASAIKSIFKVAKTKNDTPLKDGDDYLIDPSNTIKGLLSNQQTKIAQVWMKNQDPIWARQIVIPFNENEKNDALKSAISLKNFDKSQSRLEKTIANINKYGFEWALKTDMENITSVTSSSATGDLGLVTLSSDASNIKASFSYYLYRYVTSAQGVGNNSPTTTLYELPQYNGTNLDTFFNNINRTLNTSKPNQTSKYNDLMWMVDNDPEKKYSGADGNKVAIFIDVDGIHFVQTPGIAYKSTVASDPLQKIITDYTQLLTNSDKKQITWDKVKSLADRPGGLTNSPYLDYLQTQYLLWNARNETAYFNLNDSLNKFTSGTKDISNNIWWDYILGFNNNINNINWNTKSELSTILKTNINGPDEKIDNFVKSMKNWFTKTFWSRWSRLQGISNTDALEKSITDLNNIWDSYGEDAPVARLDLENIKIYLTNVGAETIWWYDPNKIIQG